MLSDWSKLYRKTQNFKAFQTLKADSAEFPEVRTQHTPADKNRRRASIAGYALTKFELLNLVRSLVRYT